MSRWRSGDYIFLVYSKPFLYFKAGPSGFFLQRIMVSVRFRGHCRTQALRPEAGLGNSPSGPKFRDSGRVLVLVPYHTAWELLYGNIAAPQERKPIVESIPLLPLTNQRSRVKSVVQDTAAFAMKFRCVL